MEKNVRRLEGKVILINGAGSGIGKACAEEYAREGAKVVVASQSKSSEAVAKAIIDSGGNAVPYSADISDEAAFKNMFGCAFETYGGINVPHNKAAMTGKENVLRATNVANMDVDLWEGTMAVNLSGDRKRQRLN